MRKILSLFILILAFSFFLGGNEKTKKKELPPQHKKWLNEDVVYIITSTEKEVFLKLETDRERDLFIDAFWRHRDPTPNTPENEFFVEHFRRINYANHFFGRTMPKPGWKTDRGRVYILLGEPTDIQRFEGKTTVYNSEVWFYQGKTNLGLPPGFNLVFFQEGGAGDYVLYSPLQNGPQALLTSYYGEPMDYSGAYEKLRELEPELAQVSLTLIPGEESSAFGRPTMSSDLLIQRVETTAVRQAEDKYARKFLEYKDIVEVDYSTNYLDSDSLVKVLRDDSGMYFVHYDFEPDRLSVSSYENKYSTTIRLNGKISDMEGKTIYQFEKDIYLNFDEERIKSLSRQPFSIHDMFPLIPGNYKLSVLLKNEASKEFCSLERNITIPLDSEALQMSSLILGYRMNQVERQPDKLKPFQVGACQLYFQANRVFVKGDTITVAFQIHSLSKISGAKAELRFAFYKGGEEFRTFRKDISEHLDSPNFCEQFSLQEFLPAHYRIQVSLFVDGQEALFESDEFDLTHFEAVPRPWVYSKILAGTEDPVYSYLTGTQLFNSGKIAEARAHLEKAFEMKPDSVEFALNLAQVYMALAEYKKIEPVLQPFLEQPQPPKYEVFFVAGKACQGSGELRKAIEVFDKAISHYGLNIHLLNSIGECHFQLGELDEAGAAWQRSLEIDPNQPLIKKSVEALKKKK